MTSTANAQTAATRSAAPESADAPFNMDWSDRFAVGIEIIDQQHQVLFRLIDQLAKAIQNDTSESELEIIFSRLHEYTRSHFATEEKLMAEHGYPADQAHHVSHRALEQSLATLIERAGGGEPLVSLQAMNFLRQWLYHHIGDVDRQLAEFLKAHSSNTRRTT